MHIIISWKALHPKLSIKCIATIIQNFSLKYTHNAPHCIILNSFWGSMPPNSSKEMHGYNNIFCYVKISPKYTPKHTKLYHLLQCRGSMPSSPPNRCMATILYIFYFMKRNVLGNLLWQMSI